MDEIFKSFLLKKLTTLFTNQLSAHQKSGIIHIWNNEYPQQLQYHSPEEFDTYLSKLKDCEHIIFEAEGGQIIGWLMVFWRDDAKWFAMILDSAFQKQGLGSHLLNLAKERNTQLNGWATDHENYRKANGEIYRSPLTFYQKNGFQILTETRFENEILSSVKIQWNKT